MVRDKKWGTMLGVGSDTVLMPCRAKVLYDVAHMNYTHNCFFRESQVMSTTFVRARIDQTLKEAAASVLAEMGLTVSDVVRIALTKIAKEKALPFDMRVPDTLTEETLAKSERGEDLHRAKDADDLFQQLGI
jgi:DNA-damage-inducible protein J